MPLRDDPVQSLRHSLLPAVTLGVGLTAIIMRQARSSLLEILRLTYITTARAKGLAERRVILQHAFKNAMLPVVTILGILLGNVMAGAVITETIFGIPGIGRLLVDSIYSRDYPVVQAIVLMIGVAVILSNLLVDVVYGYLDPASGIEPDHDCRHRHRARRYAAGLPAQRSLLRMRATACCSASSPSSAPRSSSSRWSPPFWGRGWYPTTPWRPTSWRFCSPRAWLTGSARTILVATSCRGC